MVAFVIPAVVNPPAVVLSGQLQPLTASGDIDMYDGILKNIRKILGLKIVQVKGFISSEGGISR